VKKVAEERWSFAFHKFESHKQFLSYNSEKFTTAIGLCFIENFPPKFASLSFLESSHKVRIVFFHEFFL